MASLQAKNQTSINQVSICLLLHHSQRPTEKLKFKSTFHPIFEVMLVKNGMVQSELSPHGSEIQTTFTRNSKIYSEVTQVIPVLN
jgi:hypothetical protein